MATLPFTLAVDAHIALGSLGLLLYWATISRRKGSPTHRAAGRAFFATLLAVALSVGPVLLLRSGPFQPAYVVQFTYLALCLVTVSMVGWTAIRWKADLERFRGLHFRVLGAALFILGAGVLAAGLRGGDPVAIVLSWVGLAYGGAMVRFAWTRRPVLATWWMNWHLNATCGLFTAVHGTFLYVAWRWIAQAQPDPRVAALFHVLVLVVAVVMRLWFGSRRHVPLRFTAAVPPDGTIRSAT